MSHSRIIRELFHQEHNFGALGARNRYDEDDDAIDIAGCVCLAVLCLSSSTQMQQSASCPAPKQEGGG